MKKNFLVVLSLILVFSMLLSGCNPKMQTQGQVRDIWKMFTRPMMAITNMRNWQKLR